MSFHSGFYTRGNVVGTFGHGNCFGFEDGLLMQMLFLIGVTPVMHNFWDPACYQDDQVPEMINFFKV